MDQIFSLFVHFISPLLLLLHDVGVLEVVELVLVLAWRFFVAVLWKILPFVDTAMFSVRYRICVFPLFAQKINMTMLVLIVPIAVC